MKKIKKVISLLLTCVLLVSCMYLPAHAANNPQLVVCNINAYDKTTGIDATKNISSASAGDFIVITVGVNVGDTGVNVGGCQIYLEYDKNILAPMKTGAAPFKAAYWTVSNTSISDYSWNMTMSGNPDGVVSIVGGAIADLAYEAESGETVSFVKIAFKVLEDVESVKTSFSFDSTADNAVFYYPDGVVDDTSELAGLDESATYSLDINGVTPTLNTVALETNTVTVQGGDAADQTVQATATSAKGTNITTGVEWSVVNPEGGKGVSVDASGLVSVDAKAAAGTYQIKATPVNDKSQGEAKTADLVVKRTTDRVPTAITITPSVNTVAVPVKGDTSTVTFTAVVTDQFDEPYTGSETLSWSIPVTTGVSINTSTGEVTVTNVAAQGTVNVTAECGDATKAFTLEITKATSVPAEIVIGGGQSSIDVPYETAGTAATSKFTATVTDQFGAAYTGAEEVTWGVSEATGVSIADGVVTVTNKTTVDKVTVTATCGDATKSVELTINKESDLKATRMEVYANGQKLTKNHRRRRKCGDVRRCVCGPGSRR